MPYKAVQQHLQHASSAFHDEAWNIWANVALSLLTTCAPMCQMTEIAISSRDGFSGSCSRPFQSYHQLSPDVSISLNGLTELALNLTGTQTLYINPACLGLDGPTQVPDFVHDAVIGCALQKPIKWSLELEAALLDRVLT